MKYVIAIAFIISVTANFYYANRLRKIEPVMTLATTTIDTCDKEAQKWFDSSIAYRIKYLNEQSEKESYVETIQYFKGQTVLLWDAIGVLQSNASIEAKNRKIDELNSKIFATRQEHNRKVNQDFVKDVSSIIAR